MRLILGDCLEVMRELESDSVDTVITDPPYGLGFMGKEWDTPGAFVERKSDRCQKWDNVGGNHNPTCSADAARTRRAEGRKFQAWSETWATEALRVAKPGAILLSFGGTRTYHRLACAIEDAGWEIRDCMMWLYGSGFPKSLDISKAIDKAAGAERRVIAERPAHTASAKWREAEGRADRLKPPPVTAPSTDVARLWSGYGTALKPAWEPIIVAMKPLDGTFAANAQRWGVAGLSIDGGRIDTESPRPARAKMGGDGNGIYGDGLNNSRAIDDTTLGRWPANVLLDEDAAALLDEMSGPDCGGFAPVLGDEPSRPGYAGGFTRGGSVFYGDSGGASRFFYTAKASTGERGRDNRHPTVKPIDLMTYLCRLTRTPTGGVVLDPFMGSGTTAIGCVNTGRDFIGIEKDPVYYAVARGRVYGPLYAGTVGA